MAYSVVHKRAIKSEPFNYSTVCVNKTIFLSIRVITITTKTPEDVANLSGKILDALNEVG